MTNFYKIFVVRAILLIANLGISQTIDPNYTVATWHGFQSASFTFDDGSTPFNLTLMV